MKFNKNLAIILVLISLLLSAIIFSIYLYNINKKTIAKNNQLVTIYVAKNDIKKNSFIKEDNIVKTTIAKQYLLNTALTKKEIIGKITKEAIYKNEIIIKKKISTKKEEEKKFLLDFKYSSYNMPFKLFQNPNYTLNQNDRINIVSIYVKEHTPIKKDETNEYKVQYIAKNLKVLGFIRDGKPSKNTIEKKIIKKVIQKKVIEEEVEIKADEIVLDVPNKTLLNLLNDYNKGKQLWMDKINNFKKPTVKVSSKENIKVKTIKVYPLVWYKPNSTYTTKSATIEYVNDPKLKQYKTKTIKSNTTDLCSNKDKLLIITRERANIRSGASMQNAIYKTLSKNHILPFISKDKNNWYKLCDGKYIHKNVVKEINYKEIKKRIKQ
jgi:hypothetical protein